ncbi:TetR/AcrR family transcriptional regulator [Ahrensia marina]|uniref:TetR/AcrR family transcriptional regulator n=1 Tax=Ahrensia marina TaxID=1514904 RepID=UPI0035D0C471
MKKAEPRPAQKRTRDPDSKRAALQTAAIRLFTDIGYENVSIAAIAKEAGIAVGTVYRFYENKLALLQSMLEALEYEYVEQMKADWATPGGVDVRLDRVCEGLFDLTAQRNTLLNLMSMTTDVVFDDGALPGDHIQAQIVSMYQDGVRSGAFRAGDVDLYGAMAHGLVEGAVMRWLRTGKPSQREAALQLSSVMKYGFLSRQINETGP